MTSRERFLKAMSNQVPDRVPVAPDISVYIPLKKLGLPFWDVAYYEAYPLWKAYIDAAEYFGMEFWTASVMVLPYLTENRHYKETTKYLYDKTRDAVNQHRVVMTPDGELTSRSICFRNEWPASTEKEIKDFSKDWQKFKWLIVSPSGYDVCKLEEMREACIERNQAFGLMCTYPGFQIWNCFVEGGISSLSYVNMDTPKILEEWAELQSAVDIKCMELTIAAKPDYILLGGSGTVTMASPELALKYAIPTIKKQTAMAKKAGIPTMLHSCGKQRILIDMLVEHTDMCCVNPLEIMPMGDVDLAEVKKKYGDRLSFMGNLHTTNTMLNGTKGDVLKESIKAMESAGSDGGFILSTGDQCGLNTPDENIFAMVEAVTKYGVYGASGKLSLPYSQI